MERIKTTEKLEFDAIYADGTRRHISEGVLWEADKDDNLIFHQGTDRLSVITAAAEGALMYLKRIGPGLKVLAVGMCLRAETAAVLRKLVSYALQLMDPERNVKQAIYRLGQMDMQASIADMLEDLADGTQGEVCTTLIDAAERIRSLAVCEKVEEAADGDA